MLPKRDERKRTAIDRHAGSVRLYERRDMAAAEVESKAVEKWMQQKTIAQSALHTCDQLRSETLARELGEWEEELEKREKEVNNKLLDILIILQFHPGSTKVVLISLVAAAATD